MKCDSQALFHSIQSLLFAPGRAQWHNFLCKSKQPCYCDNSRVTQPPASIPRKQVSVEVVSVSINVRFSQQTDNISLVLWQITSLATHSFLCRRKTFSGLGEHCWVEAVSPNLGTKFNTCLSYLLQIKDEVRSSSLDI